MGVGGWPALAMQIVLPALFFTIMCIPKYYIQPYQHPMFLQQTEYDIDTRWWAGASPYEGECWVVTCMMSGMSNATDRAGNLASYVPAPVWCSCSVNQACRATKHRA